MNKKYYDILINSVPYVCILEDLQSFVDNKSTKLPIFIRDDCGNIKNVPLGYGDQNIKEYIRMADGRLLPITREEHE